VLTITAMALSAGMAERRRIEEELQQQKAVVEAANRTKDHFLAMLSHELRTPLTPVISSLESLEAEPAQTEDIKAALALIRRNVELETQLIDDLLDFTRIARNKMQLRFAPLDAHLALSNVAEICRAEAEAKRLDLIMQLRAISKIPGIAISGFGNNGDIERSLQAGFSEHLIKPIKLDDLEAAIERAVAG
jgi:signal transduction histidine kinase